MKWKILTSLLTIVTIGVAFLLWVAVEPSHVPYPLHKNIKRIVSRPASDMFCKSPKTVYILSLGGGAMRGIIPAQVLHYLEQQTHKPISQLFNVIGGTSTGAIAVLALTAPNKKGKPAYNTQDLLNLYNKDGPYIFTTSLRYKIKTLGGLLGAKFNNKRKKAVFQNALGNMKLSDALTNIIITAYRVKDNESMAFINWEAKSSPERDFYAANVLNAATSPPVMFAPVKVENVAKTKSALLLDGAIGIQDPSMLVLLKTIEHYPRTDHFVLLTLGTGKFNIVKSDAEMKHWGLVKWAPYLFPMLVLAQSQERQFDLKMLNRSSKTRKNEGNELGFHVEYIPIDVKIPEDLAKHQFSSDKKHLKLFNEYGKKSIDENKKSLQRVIKLLERKRQCN